LPHLRATTTSDSISSKITTAATITTNTKRTAPPPPLACWGGAAGTINRGGAPQNRSAYCQVILKTHAYCPARCAALGTVIRSAPLLTVQSSGRE
jgi:hypothetical protein